MRVPELRVLPLNREPSGVCGQEKRLFMPRSAKGRKSPFPRLGWVRSAERGLLALLGFWGSVVSCDYQTEISNPRIKVPSTPPAQNRGNNYRLRLRVTVLYVARGSIADEGGCGIISNSLEEAEGERKHSAPAAGLVSPLPCT